MMNIFKKLRREPSMARELPIKTLSESEMEKISGGDATQPTQTTETQNKAQSATRAHAKFMAYIQS